MVRQGELADYGLDPDFGGTLWFQLENTVLLIGTFLSFDPVLFPNGSILNFEAPLIRCTFDKNNLAPIAYTFVGVSIIWIVTFSMP